MNRGSAFFLCFLTIPAFLAAQNVETKDGIRIVHNAKGGKWGAVPKIELKLIRKIGDVDTDNDHLAFYKPGDIVEDVAGNAYIADTGNYRIEKFDKNGNFSTSFGRKGQGPGEFDSIMSLSIDAAERLHVLDNTQRRIQILSKDGHVIETVRLLRRAIDSLRCAGKGLYLVHEQRPGLRPDEQKTLLKIIDSQETVLCEFCAAQDYGEPVTNQIGNSFHAAVGRDGSVVVSFTYQNKVEKYSPEGRLVWRADRPLNFETRVLEKGKYEVTADSRRYTAPKMNSCSRGIATDAAGRIWVVTYRRQIKPEEAISVSQSVSEKGMTIKREGNTDLRTTEMLQMEVFTPDGILLGAVPLSQFVDGIWIYADRLYLLDRDRGVTYYQYKIVER